MVMTGAATTPSWQLRYADSVVKTDIPVLDHAVKQRIRAVIEHKLGVDPLRFGKPLCYSLHHLRSLRVGDYRILYQIDHMHKLVSIVAIDHRRDVYEA
jgi:mRNA interferase RelE/StbE